MSDKEKMMNVLNYHTGDNTSIEDIIIMYLAYNEKDFSSVRLTNLIDILNKEFLYPRLENLENLKRIAKERALYLKTYLSGEMWADEESARRNLQPQINNAQAIMDACNSK